MPPEKREAMLAEDDRSGMNRASCEVCRGERFDADVPAPEAAQEPVRARKRQTSGNDLPRWSSKREWREKAED